MQRRHALGLLLVGGVPACTIVRPTVAVPTVPLVGVLVSRRAALMGHALALAVGERVDVTDAETVELLRELAQALIDPASDSGRADADSLNHYRTLFSRALERNSETRKRS